MQMNYMMKYISLVIVSFFLVSFTTPVSTNLDNELLLKLVNEKRASGCKCGNKYMPPVSPLTWNDAIAEAAAKHSKDMDRRNFFSHTSSDGKSLKDRFQLVNYKWMAIGENIAMGQPDEYAVMNSWLKSPGHCMNLMNANFKEMGAARNGKYWTQDFGTKRNW
jgi:uncharacterized protein YkwD